MHSYKSSSLILLVSIMLVLLDPMNGIDSRAEAEQSLPSEKSPAEVLSTDTPEDRNEKRDDADTYENSSSSDENLQETTDKIVEKLVSKKLEKVTEKLLAASSSSESSPRKPQKTYSQALMAKFAPAPDEYHQRSEASEDVKNTLPLDDRLKGIMDDALKALVAENILEAPSPNDSEEGSHHSLESSVTPSSPTQKLVDKPNEECSSPKKDTNVSAFTSHQIDSPDAQVQPEKKSSEGGDKEASERPPSAAKDDKSSSKTEEDENASVEDESSTSSSSSTKKMSYALALMGSSRKVDNNTDNKDIKGKRLAVDDETSTQKSPTPAEARAKQTENKNKEPVASEDSSIELFCPPEPQREAIQTNATSINLKYNANRRQVLISPRRSNVNVFHEFRRLNVDLRKFGVHTSVCLPSGSVFLKFENEAGPRRLHEAIFSTGLFQMATTRSSPCQVRIHGVPFETNMAELYYDLHMKYDAIPQRVRFTRDERDPRGTRGSLAIIEVSESLLQKMAEAPDIRIRWCSRKIETTVRIFRCSNCYVLGHRSDFCRLPKRSAPTIYEPCVDCTYHNRCSELIGRPNDRARDTNHRTDDYERCMTKQIQVSRTQGNHNGREVELRPLLM